VIAEDREPLQVAPDTVLVEPANAPRYGKSSLLTPKKDKQGNWQWTDLRRAVGHATYLLNTHDPGGQARAAGKVGLISFKDCVDTIGDALNIPKYRRMWFWGSRGSNALEDCDILLLVGTPALAPDEVEEYARDLHRQGPQPIVAFTSRFFIKPPPEPYELWSWCSSFWEPRASLATVPGRSGPPPIHHLGSTCRR